MEENRTSKIDFIKEVEKVVRMTDAFEDLSITYGWLENKYSKPDEETGEVTVIDRVFHPSDRVLNNPDDEREMLRFKWGEQSDYFCLYQSIEADSYYGILRDVYKALDKLA